MAVNYNSFSIKSRQSVGGWRPLPHRHKDRTVDLRNLVFFFLAAIYERNRNPLVINAVLEPSLHGLVIYFNVSHLGPSNAVCVAHVGQPVLRLTGSINYFDVPVCGGLIPHFSSKKSASAILPGDCELGGVVKSTIAQSGSFGICLALLR